LKTSAAPPEIFRVAVLPQVGHLPRGLSVIFWNFSKA